MNTTSRANIKQERNIGIDVGKTFLDIHILECDRYWQIHNTESDIKNLIKTLRRYNLTRIVVEATGGYERSLVEALADAEMPVVVVQPMNIRQFAKAQGVMAKTDKIDARVIAQFSAIMKPEVRAISSKKVRYVKDLLARKRQLIEAKTQELNRLHKSVNRLDVNANVKLTHHCQSKIDPPEANWLLDSQQGSLHDYSGDLRDYPRFT